MGKLNEKAILVSLNISLWTARKFDKKATQETAEKHNLGAGAGRYEKNLVFDSPAYALLKEMASAERLYHYRMTLPWGDNVRILSSALYMEYAAHYREACAKWERVVREFEEEYPGIVERARLKLNGLFNPGDYPSPSEIGECFSLSVKSLPVPEGGDFRVNLSNDELEVLREQVEGQVQQATAHAMREVWTRLYEVVGRIAEQVPKFHAGEIKRFTDTITENVKDLCRILPALNLTGDTHLETLAARVEQELAGYSAEDLREEATGLEAAKRAASIQDAMSAYMGGR